MFDSSNSLIKKNKVLRLTKIEKNQISKNSERKLHIFEYSEKLISKLINPKFIVHGVLFFNLTWKGIN
jgi:hypothetical protein